MAANALTVTLGSQVLTGVDSAGAEWHTFDPIAGWDGAPAMALETTQRPRSSGVFVTTRPQMSARVIALQGLVSAPNPDALLAAMDRLNLAAPEYPATTLTVVRGASTRSISVLRQDEVIVNGVHDTLAEWSMQFLAPDPRRLDLAQAANTALFQATGTPRTIPFTIPFALNATIITGQVSLTNAGVYDGPVTVTVYGPVNGPTVTWTGPAGNTRTIALPNLNLNLGDALVITDVYSQTAILNGSTAMDRYMTSRGWWAFQPGVNTFTFTASSFSSGALMRVQANSAY